MTSKNISSRKVIGIFEMISFRRKSWLSPILSTIRRDTPFFSAETELSTNAIYLQKTSESKSGLFHLTGLDMFFRSKKVPFLQKKRWEQANVNLDELQTILKSKSNK